LKPVKKLKGLESFNATVPQDDVGVNPLDTAFSGMTLEVLKEIGEYYLEDEIEEPIKEKNIVNEKENPSCDSKVAEDGDNKPTLSPIFEERADKSTTQEQTSMSN